MISNYSVFRPRQAKVEILLSKAEAKAQEIEATARSILAAEKSARDAKTERLRHARLQRELKAGKVHGPPGGG